MFCKGMLCVCSKAGTMVAVKDRQYVMSVHCCLVLFCLCVLKGKGENNKAWHTIFLSQR